ncbi:uncharacterized protein LOC122267464 [Penaeus japonicus]|uniref:uncharacterized protein LOC122267464 n=1 Tax=Penaeus japonicus TaxID=27405 RepID=UPI001C71698D|nr:uncharacterized protein LOC122267464 [Penaeus japonicus]
MGRLFAILFGLFLAGAQICNALVCYECFGYDPSKPPNVVTNNPSCVAGSFDPLKVNHVQSSVNVSKPFCAAFTARANGVLMTVRGSIDALSNAKEISTGYLEGYICNDADDCNGRDTSAAGSRSILLALVVFPAALVKLLS